MRKIVNIFDKYRNKEHTSPVAMLLDFRSDDDFAKFTEFAKNDLVKNAWNALCKVQALCENVKNNFNEICFYLYFIHKLDKEFIGNYDVFITTLFKKGGENFPDEYYWILLFLRTINYHD